MSGAALIPLMGAVRNLGIRKAFLLGWTAGLVWFFVSFNWISQTISRFGDFPFPLNQLAIVVIASAYATYVGAFAAAVPTSNRVKGMWKAFYLASAWVLLEYIRTWVPVPFPWLLLGSVFWKSPLVSPIYGVGGVHSLSFLVVAVNVLLWSALTDFLSGSRRRALMTLGSLMSLAAASVTVGYFARPEPGAQRANVAVVQGNFPQEVKWQESARQETLETYLGMTKKATAGGADLAVWPETAMPFYFQAEEDLAARLRDFASGEGIHIIFGSPAFAVRLGEIQLFNSAFHIGPDEWGERYDKVILVPFGEYVPFSRFLPFLERLVPGEGEFSTGGVQEPFHTPFRSGALICFEVTFPHLSRRQVLQGAEILVNITNDGWFGSTWGPYQHLAVSAVRAAENGVPVIRAANTGISAVFDSDGRLLSSIGLHERGVMVTEITLGRKKTIYTRTGNWIVYLSTIVILIISLLNIISWRKTRWIISTNSDGH